MGGVSELLGEDGPVVSQHALLALPSMLLETRESGQMIPLGLVADSDTSWDTDSDSLTPALVSSQESSLPC